MLAGAVLAFVLAPGPASTPHPDSLSSTQVVIAGEAAYVTVRCQALSLAEVVDGLDANGDGDYSQAEIDARADEIHAYVAAHYRLFVGTDRQLAGGEQLRAAPIGLTARPPGAVPVIGARFGSVDVELVYRPASPDAGPIRDLMIHSTLFAVTSPAHVDVCSISWSDEVTATLVMDADEPRARSDPEGKGALRAFVVQGWRHILSGWDHIAFVLVLLLGARRLRSLLWLVTAFTVAHSITLALMSVGPLNLYGYSHWIEAAIALSIAYVATDNLIGPERERSRWIEAFAFGLVHGLGFAGFLAQSLVAERAKVSALVGFNLGVEAGQVAVVLAALLVFRVLSKVLPGDPGPEDSSSEDSGPGAASPVQPRGFLAPRLARTAGSLAIGAVGFFWFFQRVWT